MVIRSTVLRLQFGEGRALVKAAQSCDEQRVRICQGREGEDTLMVIVRG